MAKITEDSIKAKIKSVDYLVKDLEEGPRMTLAFITMENGFIATGQSCCVNTSDYDEQQGKDIAFDNAFDKLWEVEGYLAKELQHRGLGRVFHRIDVGDLSKEDAEKTLDKALGKLKS